MGFEILNKSFMSTEEILLRRKLRGHSLTNNHVSRRQFGRLTIGLSAALVAPTLTARPESASAQSADLIPAVFDGGIFFEEDIIEVYQRLFAHFFLANETDWAQHKPCYVETRHPDYGRTGFDFLSARIEPYQKVKVGHNGFKGKNPGINKYNAQTHLDAKSSSYEVIPA